MISNNRSPLLALFGFTLLVVMVFSSMWLVNRQDQTFALVREGLEVENRLSSLLSAFQDVETGMRGYLLTGEANYLVPHDAALPLIDPQLAALARATADNPRLQASLKQLGPLWTAKRNLLSRAIDDFRSGGRGVPIAQLDEGKALMDRMRVVVAAMKAEENNILLTRELVAEREAWMAEAAQVLSAVLILMLAFFTVREAHRQVVASVTSAAKLATANTDLQAELEAREAAEGQVRQMQKLESIGQLTGGIAHDFNNMLTVVIWSLDLAKRRFETDRVRALKCIDMALEGANSAAQLTARLLAFSRQQALQPKALDVNQLLIGMTEMLRHTIGAHMRVEAVLGAGLWTAYVDHSQIENAILNLAINARDAMTDGGCLTVETSNAQLDTAYALSNPGAVAGEYVLVSVTDTGVGMDAATAAQVYDPFFTTKGPGKGTGLGLSQVQGFVKQSGGHVKIYSEPGHGTTVRLYLPRQHDVSGVVNPQLPENDAAAVQAKSGEVILVVEDDERIRSLSVDALRDLGYTVVHAADGTQALAILGDERRIDLLFTDIVMPFMNGRQLAAKAHEARPELKVLYTTGFTRDVVVHKGELDANEALIGKPFTLAELTMKVRLVLDGRDGCRETFSQMN